jgi:MFS family permease
MQQSRQYSGSADLAGAERHHRSEFRRALNRFMRYRAGLVGLAFVIALTILAIMPGVFSPHSPTEIFSGMRGASPSSEHWLGNDHVGRDVLTRTVWGAQTALLVGVIATTMTAIIGVAVGAVAGYFGGWTDSILSRLIDTVMAVPLLAILLVLAAVLAIGLDPAVRSIERRGSTRGRAVTLIFMGALAIAILFAWLVIPPLVTQVGELADDIPGYVQELSERDDAIGRYVRENDVAERLQRFVEQLPQKITRSFGTIAGVLAMLVTGMLTARFGAKRTMLAGLAYWQRRSVAQFFRDLRRNPFAYALALPSVVSQPRNEIVDVPK